jgi:hypothetical protein
MDSKRSVRMVRQSTDISQSGEFRCYRALQQHPQAASANFLASHCNQVDRRVKERPVAAIPPILRRFDLRWPLLTDVCQGRHSKPFLPFSPSSRRSLVCLRVSTNPCPNSPPRPPTGYGRRWPPCASASLGWASARPSRPSRRPRRPNRSARRRSSSAPVSGSSTRRIRRSSRSPPSDTGPCRTGGRSRCPTRSRAFPCSMASIEGGWMYNVCDQVLGKSSSTYWWLPDTYKQA